VDWNNDGKKDLLTGENYGYIRIYLNSNTDSDPQFSGYTYLKKGAANFDCGSYSVPWVVDWNNDGKKDVLCGDSNGRVQYLENVGTDANPQFTTSVYLQDGVSVLDPGSTVSPCVIDFNRDGKKDLLVGETYGNVFFYENKGTDAAPAFNGWVKIATGTGLIDVGYYARPTTADWDNDGMPEVLIGESYGYIKVYDARGPLFGTTNQISEATGGNVRFTIDAGAANAGRLYALFGSASGTEPGVPLSPSATLAINWDPITQVLISLYSTPVCTDFYGNLNANGQAMAILNTQGALPAGSAGVVLSFGFALMDFPMDFASNGMNILIVP
jgi:hypothetical protein